MMGFLGGSDDRKVEEKEGDRENLVNSLGKGNEHSHVTILIHCIHLPRIKYMSTYVCVYFAADIVIGLETMHKINRTCSHMFNQSRAASKLYTIHGSDTVLNPHFQVNAFDYSKTIITYTRT